MNYKQLLIICLVTANAHAMNQSIFTSPINAWPSSSSQTIPAYFACAHEYIENGQLEDLSTTFMLLERLIQGTYEPSLRANALLNLVELTIEAMHRHHGFQVSLNLNNIFTQLHYMYRPFIEQNNRPLFLFLNGYYAPDAQITLHCYNHIIQKGDIVMLTQLERAHVYGWLASYFASTATDDEHAQLAKEYCMHAYQYRTLLNPAMQSSIDRLHAQIGQTARALPGSPVWRSVELSSIDLALQKA